MWQLDKNPNFIIFNIIHFHWLLIYLLNTIPENEALSVNVVNTNKQYNPISKPSLGVILPSNRFSLIRMWNRCLSSAMYNWKVVWQVSSRNTCFTLWLLPYVTRNHKNIAAPVTNDKNYFQQLKCMKLQAYDKNNQV